MIKDDIALIQEWATRKDVVVQLLQLTIYGTSESSMKPQNLTNPVSQILELVLYWNG